MKLIKKNANLTAAYLYADGHAVICYEQQIRVGKVCTALEYCDIHEKITDADLNFKGRIVLHRYHAAAYLHLIQTCDRVSCRIPDIEMGSEKTKQLGLHVGYLMFDYGNSCVEIPTLSDGQTFETDVHHSICSNGYTYQPHTEEKFSDLPTWQDEWGNTKVSAIYREKHEELNQVAA
jgi:hypothetical protein